MGEHIFVFEPLAQLLIPLRDNSFDLVPVAIINSWLNRIDLCHQFVDLEARVHCLGTVVSILGPGIGVVTQNVAHLVSVEGGFRLLDRIIPWRYFRQVHFDVA